MVTMNWPPSGPTHCLWSVSLPGSHQWWWKLTFAPFSGHSTVFPFLCQRVPHPSPAHPPSHMHVQYQVNIYPARRAASIMTSVSAPFPSLSTSKGSIPTCLLLKWCQEQLTWMLIFCYCLKDMSAWLHFGISPSSILKFSKKRVQWRLMS